MPESGQHRGDVWEMATPSHLLQYLKLCGVEQTVIARELGVSQTAVSLWAGGHRPVPAKYRPRLLAWVPVARHEARERLQKHIAVLPTDALKRAAVEDWSAPFTRWHIGVMYDADEVKASARKNARWLLELLEHETYTPSELEQMRGLYLVLGNKLDILEEMAGPQAASAAPEQEGVP
jgi:predicted transcriptional regulator